MKSHDIHTSINSKLEAFVTSGVFYNKAHVARIRRNRMLRNKAIMKHTKYIYLSCISWLYAGDIRNKDLSRYVRFDIIAENRYFTDSPF